MKKQNSGCLFSLAHRHTHSFSLSIMQCESLLFALFLELSYFHSLFTYRTTVDQTILKDEGCMLSKNQNRCCRPKCFFIWNFKEIFVLVSKQLKLIDFI